MNVIPADCMLNFLKAFSQLNHNQLNLIDHQQLSKSKMRIYDRRALFEQLLTIKSEFGLSNKHVKILSKYFAIIKRLKITNEYDLSIGSVVAMNRRLDRMFEYMPKLSVEYEKMLTTSPKPGFVLLRKKNLPRSVFTRLRAKFNVIKYNTGDELNSIIGYISEGNIVIVDDDIDIMCEKYSYDVGSFPSVITHISDLVERGNFLIRRFISSPSLIHDPVGYFYELSRHMYEVTSMQTISPIMVKNEELEQIVVDKFVIDLEFWQGERYIHTKLISRLRIDLRYFESNINDVSDMKFEFSASCLDDLAVKDNVGNILFRSELYYIGTKLEIENDKPFKIIFSIIDKFVGYNYGLVVSSRELLSNLLVSNSFFISVIGPKGSGKSKFLKLYNDVNPDVLSVDSDVYGCYIFHLLQKVAVDGYTVGDFSKQEYNFELYDFVDSLSAVFDWQSKYGNLDGLPSIFTLRMAYELNKDILNDDLGLEMVNWCARVFDDRNLGLIRFQNSLIQYAHSLGYNKILYFGHTSVENYYLNVDATFTISPNFFEPVVLIGRSRSNAAIEPLLNEYVSLDLIELSLYVTYNKFIDRTNSTGWLGIYELFGLEIETDVTKMCVNYSFKSDGVSSEAVVMDRLFILPTYVCSRPIFNVSDLYGARLLVLPIGHGKSYYSETHDNTIQIDDLFEAKTLSKLFFSKYHYSSLDYLITVCRYMIRQLKLSGGAYDAVFVHNSSVCLAFGVNSSAFILNDKAVGLYDVTYDDDIDKVSNMKNNIEAIKIDGNISEIFEYPDLDSLHTGVGHILSGLE